MFPAPASAQLPTRQTIARQFQRAAVDGVRCIPVGQCDEPTAMPRRIGAREPRGLPGSAPGVYYVIKAVISGYTSANSR
jgi:hypothetical protein